MIYTIQNQQLAVAVDTLGAQLMSIRRDGCEYLWQGDPAYWSERAPVLFPVIGRLEGQQYMLDGQRYPMPIHGFARQMDFALERHTADALVLSLRSAPETRAVYPFDFVLEITYRLLDSVLSVASRVTNSSAGPMHFALGGHPGFRVPLERGETFADYYLEFDREASPERIGFTADTVLVSGERSPYPLADGKYIPLRHDLFDSDAVILRGMAPGLALKSRRSRRSVTLSCPDAAFLGLWHSPHTEAPFLCLEPWTSLPGRSGVTEDIARREDFIHLAAGAVYENCWTAAIG